LEIHPGNSKSKLFLTSIKHLQSRLE
jgi:hypothetical protein